MRIKQDGGGVFVGINGDHDEPIATFYGPDAMRHAVQFVTANRAWDALVVLGLKHEWTLMKDGAQIELNAYSGDVQVSQASTTVDDLLSAIARVVMADSPEGVTA